MARKLDVMSHTTSCLLYSLVTRQWLPLRLITQQLNSTRQSHYTANRSESRLPSYWWIYNSGKQTASPSRQFLSQNAPVKITANQWPITKWRTQRNASTNTRQPIMAFHSRPRITWQQQSPYFPFAQPITDAHVSRDHGTPMYVTHTN